jgi:hypothetical protein
MVVDVVDWPMLQAPQSINVMTGQTASCIQPEYSPVGKYHTFTHENNNLENAIIAHSTHQSTNFESIMYTTRVHLFTLVHVLILSLSLMSQIHIYIYIVSAFFLKKCLGVRSV